MAISTDQQYDFEKVLAPFVRNKSYVAHYPGMFCDCPFCHSPYALRVLLQEELADCKKCNFKGSKKDVIQKLYLEKIEISKKNIFNK